MAAIQKIKPFLWFNRQAEEAANFYVSLFNDSKTGAVMRHGDAVMLVDFSLAGQSFSALNGGPQFSINPSISFFVACETATEIDALWNAFLEGGSALMPLDKYPWSERYGWVQDRFGVNWQLILGKPADYGGQKITPSLLFTGTRAGKAETAMEFYSAVFADSGITQISRYEADGTGREKMVQYAQFRLNGQTFVAMDSPIEHGYTFNEAFSFVVSCENQQEVDYYWEKLIAGGGEESQCGWLKDPFGVSWQVVPTALPQLLSDPDPVKAQTAMAALMQMRKIEIDKLTQAPPKTAITVEATVNAPVEKVWHWWTAPEHITQWNQASDDWHTPYAENDLRPGGKILCRMEAKDGSMGFDFEGTNEVVDEHRRIVYVIADGRKVEITFKPDGDQTHITETFEAENMNSLELQQTGWQAILNNFKKYAENYAQPGPLHFSIGIRAAADKVYATMLDAQHYADWTSAFNATSHYRGSWEKGSKILFIGADNDGNLGGMVSRIKENIPNEFISIEHLGLIENGREITSGPQVESWAGALENYTFQHHNGVTRLSVSLDSNEDFKDYFLDTWPKALARLKAICEN